MSGRIVAQDPDVPSSGEASPQRRTGASRPTLVVIYLAAASVLATLALRYIMGSLISPGNDFVQIVWLPGQDILTRGVVAPTYPYPVWTPVLLLPLALGTPQLGATLWLSISLLMLGAAVVALTDVLRWPRWLALPLAAAMVVQDRVAVGLWAGQVLVVVLLAVVLLLLALRTDREGAIAALLSVTLLKPHMTVLLTLGLLGWALYHRRWRIIVIFTAIALGLVALAAPFSTGMRYIPGGGVAEHAEHGLLVGSTLGGLLLTLAPQQLWLPAAIAAVLLLWLAWYWIRIIHENTLRWHAVELVSFTIVINLLVLPYSWSYNLTLLWLPVCYLLGEYWRIGGPRRWLASSVAFVLLFQGSWALAPFNQDVWYALMPLTVLVALLIHRTFEWHTAPEAPPTMV